jgi:choline kinase
MKVIILAAGMGMRLNSPLPKCLTTLSNGTSIIGMQLKNLLPYVSLDDIFVVVGYKKELVMEAFPDLAYVYNFKFASSGAARSLDIALRKIKKEDVLWLNGDALFHSKIIEKVLRCDDSCMVVNRSDSLGDEEVKYLLNSDGSIRSVSKSLPKSKGEVLGINLIKADSLELIKTSLQSCTEKDFAIRCVDLAIGSGLKIFPVYIDEHFCMEVDFYEDLQVVNENLNKLI